MEFSMSYLRELYQKAYQDAIRANELHRYDIAKKKFLEASIYLDKLTQYEIYNNDKYRTRAERLRRIADSIRVSDKKGKFIADSNVAVYESNNTNKNQMSTAEEMSSFYTFYKTDQLEGFDSVIGLEEAKEAITEYAINPIKYPNAYNYKFINSVCILLEGPPGTGKTTFAKAVAKELSQPFVLINVASLVNCYVGETGKIIDKVFASLREYVEQNNCNITVFFDEFDEIAKSRAGDDKASNSAVPALLRNLDGIKENKNFLILANTNCKDSLDAGILSRFRRKIHIPLPNLQMRKDFFKRKLEQLEPEFYEKLNIEEAAFCSDGFSGRAISQICDDYLYFVAGIKAGIRECNDYHQALINIINSTKQ